MGTKGKGERGQGKGERGKEKEVPVCVCVSEREREKVTCSCYVSRKTAESETPISPCLRLQDSKLGEKGDDTTLCYKPKLNHPLDTNSITYDDDDDDGVLQW